MDVAKFLTNEVADWYKDQTGHPRLIAEHYGIPEDDPKIVEKLDEFRTLLGKVIENAVGQIGGNDAIVWIPLDEEKPITGDPVMIKGIGTIDASSPGQVMEFTPTHWKK